MESSDVEELEELAWKTNPHHRGACRPIDSLAFFLVGTTGL